MILPFALRVQIVAILAALLFAGLIIDLVRRRRLNERYSLLWLATGAVVGAFAFIRPLQFGLAHLVGLYYPPVLILGTILFLLLGITLHQSVVLTRLEAQNRRLAQKLAILESYRTSTGVAGVAGAAGALGGVAAPAGEEGARG